MLPGSSNFDYAMHSGSFIVQWNPISVFSSEFRIGFNHLEVIDVDGRDQDDLIYTLQLRYQPESTSTWTLSTVREIVNSFFRDNSAFQSTAIQLTWDQRFGVKWRSTSLISYEVNRYNISSLDVVGGGIFKLRKDERFQGTLSLIYSIQEWWDVSMEYSYTNNDSNFNENDFSRNNVFLRFSFVL